MLIIFFINFCFFIEIIKKEIFINQYNKSVFNQMTTTLHHSFYSAFMIQLSVFGVCPVTNIIRNLYCLRPIIPPFKFMISPIDQTILDFALPNPISIPFLLNDRPNKQFYFLPPHLLLLLHLPH